MDLFPNMPADMPKMYIVILVPNYISLQPTLLTITDSPVKYVNAYLAAHPTFTMEKQESKLVWKERRNSKYWLLIAKMTSTYTRGEHDSPYSIYAISLESNIELNLSIDYYPTVSKLLMPII